MNKELLKLLLLILIGNKIENAEIPSDICSGINEMILPHPDPTRCTEFIICVLNNPFHFRCSRPNEIFYPPVGDCLPGDPETCELLIRSTTSGKTTQTTKITENSTPIVPETTEIEESTLIIIPTPESTTTIEVTENSTTEKYSTSVKETTTSSPPTTTPIPVHRCPPGGFGYIPHHTNCSRYFECIGGIRHLRFCPYGLLFDSVTLQCTYPELAVCAGGW